MASAPTDLVLEALKYVLGGSPLLLLLLVLLLFFPEKIEKLSALFWRALAGLGGVFRSAHKRYVKHDLQGRINDFVAGLRRNVPDLGQEKLRVEWVEPNADRESFLADGKVVLRLRRDDPDEHNFIHGAYLYVSGALLYTAKRYLSPSQRESIDLFVTAKLVEKEKPSARGVFLDEYLHPRTEEKRSKISLYLDDYAVIDRGSLFFPLFVQELHYLGQKVFGRRREDLVRKEVHGLIEFLKPIARRKVGEHGDLNYPGNYCRFGLVIIGKPAKLLQSIEPYVGYIRNQLVKAEADTIYLLARSENRRRVEEIANRFAGAYDPVRRASFRALLRYSDRTESARQFLLVLRRKGVELIQPSRTP